MQDPVTPGHSQSLRSDLPAASQDRDDTGGMTMLMNEQRVMWLVRHGETTWNSMGWVQGQIDGARLTRRGRYQARHAADLLAVGTGRRHLSSDLYRARRTATTISKRLGYETRTDWRLRERCFGLAEGVPSAGVPSSLTGIENGQVVDQLPILPVARPSMTSTGAAGPSSTTCEGRPAPATPSWSPTVGASACCAPCWASRG